MRNTFSTLSLDNIYCTRMDVVGLFFHTALEIHTSTIDMSNPQSAAVDHEPQEAVL